MKPEIIQNGEFIEVIGHYDDEVQCAKMTILAELYAVEHRDGYAKFRLEDANKLGLVNERLEFEPGSTYFDIPNGAPQDLYVFCDFGTGFIEAGGRLNKDDTYYTTSPLFAPVQVKFKFCTDDAGETIAPYNLTVLSGDATVENDNIVVVNSARDADISISFTAPTTQVSIDLTTLSGWSGLSDGSHSITVKAKATGYRDSEASQAVSVTKAPEQNTVTLTNTASDGGVGFRYFECNLYEGVYDGTQDAVAVIHKNETVSLHLENGLYSLILPGVTVGYILESSGDIISNSDRFTVSGSGSISFYARANF